MGGGRSKKSIYMIVIAEKKKESKVRDNESDREIWRGKRKGIFACKKKNGVKVKSFRFENKDTI